MDKVLIYDFMGEASLGLYAFLVQLVSMLLLVLNAINVSVIPVLNRLYFSDRDMYWIKLREVSALKLVISFILISGLVGLGNIIIPFLVGEDFIYEPALLYIFSAYIMLISLTAMNTEYYVLAGLLRPFFYIRIITLLLNLVLNVYLIPRWGLLGAATATVMSDFALKILFPLLFKDMRIIVWNNILSINYLFHKELYKHMMQRMIKLLPSGKTS